MPYEGNPQVLENLFRKQRLHAAGDVDHYKYRPLILALSGVMRGVCGGAHAIALDKFGLCSVFDVAVGVSTGAPMLGFFLAGQIKECLSVYWDEAAGKKFIDFNRLWKRGRPVADTDYICGVFRTKMDQRAVIRSRTSMYAAATNVHTGKGVLLDVKATKPDPIEAMHASCAMPRLCGRTVCIDGVEYVDGAASIALPVRKVIEQFNPTDILVLANGPMDEKEKWLGRNLAALLVKEFSRDFQKAFLNRNNLAERELTYLKRQKKCNYGIMWSRDGIRPFERNSNVLQAAALLEEGDMHALLARAKAQVNNEIETAAAE